MKSNLITELTLPDVTVNSLLVNLSLGIVLSFIIAWHYSRRSSGPNFLNNYQDSTKLVVEIKVNKRDQRLIKEVQHFIPFSSRRFSKYCESMSSSNLYST